MQFLITIEQNDGKVSVRSNRLLNTSEIKEVVETGEVKPCALAALADFMMKAADVWLVSQHMTPQQRHAYVDQCTIKSNHIN